MKHQRTSGIESYDAAAIYMALREPFRAPADLMGAITDVVREVVAAKIASERATAAVDRIDDEPLVMPEFVTPTGLPPLISDSRRIKIEVANAYDVSVLDIESERRTRRAVIARHCVMYRLRMETTLSLSKIGRALGGRDHTTVRHGIKAHAKRYGLDESNLA